MSESDEKLTERETEVLYYLTKSLTNKEIAAILDVTHHTIKAHVSAILKKLQCKNRTNAALFALQNKYIFDNFAIPRQDLEQP